MFLKYRNIMALIAVLFAFSTCIEQTRSAIVWNNGRFETPLRDLDGILEEGKLRVVVDYNLTNYFVYRGRPMGFKYEILKKLANDMDLRLELVVSNDLEETLIGLESGRFDLAAKNLTITHERSQRVDFTLPIGQTRQMLVQLRESPGSQHHFIRNQLDLAGQTVVVQKGSSFADRLHNIQDEIGSLISIREDSIMGVEQLVTQVAEGTIGYTVCDENVALLYMHNYPQIDANVPLSFHQNIAWAVRKDTHRLKAFLDDWLINFAASGELARLEQKYFAGQRGLQRATSEWHSNVDGRISGYDELIQTTSRHYGLDWRLVASVVFQESQFDAEAVSWAGATGLMQLMPETAETMGVSDIYDPAENIRGGIKLLAWLDAQFAKEISNSDERTKFVLAAYNVGLGHVRDAQRLAEKFGRDPLKWKDNVDFYLLNKSVPIYYNDPVVRWGYARGREPYEFVNSVLSHFGHYANLLPE